MAILLRKGVAVMTRSGALWGDPQVGCLYRLKSQHWNNGPIILVIAVEPFDSFALGGLRGWPKITVLKRQKVVKWSTITEFAWQHSCERLM